MKKDTKTIRILLADDHMIVRQGIHLLIEDLFEDTLVFQAASLQQIRELSEKQTFDIAILDAQYSDGNCITVIPELKERQPELKVLVFTSFEEENYALRFIEAGANGYLSKLSDEKAIKKAILELHETGSFATALTKKLLVLKEINPTSLNPLNALSEREREIALLYTKGYGNLEIANELDLKQNTISTFKSRIFEKLNINSIVELADLVKLHNEI